jgi:hypothetical protein
MEQNQDKLNISTVVGYILLTPPLVGVLLFTYTLFSDSGFFILNSWEDEFWSGVYSKEGGGYSSTIPLYLGLMAIAGAYLIKDNKK